LISTVTGVRRSGSLTREVGLAVVSFVREVRQIQKRSGLLFLALYLKQCGVCLQRYYALSHDKHQTLSVSVSLTRSGIPRIIPSVLRKHIRDRSERGDYIVKLYLSWFGLSKVIELAPRISKKTFSSITSVPQDYEGYKDKITSFLAEMKDQSE